MDAQEEDVVMKAAARGDVDALRHALARASPEQQTRSNSGGGEQCASGGISREDHFTNKTINETLAACYDETTGMTALMNAAQSGSLESVMLLLQNGAVWNAQCKRGMTAGEYALNAEKYSVADAILNHAVQCELILGTIERTLHTQNQNESKVRNEAYLKGRVNYISGGDDGNGDVRLVDENDDGVMMGYVFS